MLENEIAKYVFGGVAISVAGKLTSMGLKGELKELSEQKKYYDAVRFVIETYKKEDWEELKSDSRFAEKFIRTQDYFAKKQNEACLEEKLDEKANGKNDKAEPLEGKTKKTVAKKIAKGISSGKMKYFTKAYWAGDGINNAKFKYKLMGSALVPFFFDLAYGVSGALGGKVTFSSWLGELGETVFEAPSMLLGLYLGKGVNKAIDWRMNRYDKKLAKLEKKIGMNEDLKSALAEKFDKPIAVPVAPPAAPAATGEQSDINIVVDETPETEQEPEKTQNPAKKEEKPGKKKRSIDKIIEDSTSGNKDLVDQLKGLSGQVKDE